MLTTFNYENTVHRTHIFINSNVFKVLLMFNNSSKGVGVIEFQLNKDLL